MNTLRASTAILLLATLLAGCAQPQAPAPEPAATTDAAATESAPVSEAAPAETAPTDAAPTDGTAPADDATPGDATPPAAASPVAPQPIQLAAATSVGDGQFIAGRDYVVLTPTRPTDVDAGKIEVLEFFAYSCIHCFEIDPILENWKKSKPANIEFIRVPVTWGPQANWHARLFYTLQVLGQLDRLHNKVFDTFHRGGNPLLGNDEDSTLRVQRAWAEANGVDGAAFEREWKGFAVSTAIQRANQQLRRYPITGTPALAVAGKYITNVPHVKVPPLIEALAAAESRR
ncbi:MAG: thiol:disulfide interchange protein DsbA/DsbL [Steroidobacteraceae bacterium]